MLFQVVHDPECVFTEEPAETREVSNAPGPTRAVQVGPGSVLIWYGAHLAGYLPDRHSSFLTLCVHHFMCREWSLFLDPGGYVAIWVPWEADVKTTDWLERRTREPPVKDRGREHEEAGSFQITTLVWRMGKDRGKEGRRIGEEEPQIAAQLRGSLSRADVELESHMGQKRPSSRAPTEYSYYSGTAWGEQGICMNAAAGLKVQHLQAVR